MRIQRVIYGLAGVSLIAASFIGSWPHAELRAQTYSKPVDLALAASASADTLPPGATFTIEYTVSNAGPGAAHGIVLASETGPKAKPIATSGCLEDPIPAPQCTLSLPNGQLGIGDSGSATFTFQIGARATFGSFAVESAVSAAEPDHNPGNEYNSTMVTVVSQLPN